MADKSTTPEPTPEPTPERKRAVVVMVLATVAEMVATLRAESFPLAKRDLPASYLKFNRSAVTVRDGSADGLPILSWKWAPNSGNVTGILSAHLPHLAKVAGGFDPVTTDLRFVIRSDAQNGSVLVTDATLPEILSTYRQRLATVTDHVMGGTA